MTTRTERIQEQIDHKEPASPYSSFPWQLLVVIIVAAASLMVVVMVSNVTTQIDTFEDVLAAQGRSSDQTELEALIRAALDRPTTVATTPVEVREVQVEVPVPMIAIGVATGAANIREGQGAETPQIGTVTEGEEVQLLQCDDWCQIRTADGTTAWISDNFIRFLRVEAPQ